MKAEDVKIGTKLKINNIFHGYITMVTNITKDNYVCLGDHGYIIKMMDLIHLISTGYFMPMLDKSLSKECQHEMKEYLGFTAKYNYCIKCDHKEYK